ncbi:dihydrofolate reductase [Pontibacter cellulosilyticus]|uniref:Dihydrofolate reductase n=1 Tax=Pontibacter cellulosilyticus TaxID=1720253 RepID=A0A923NB14_9BACT|nr:dihydrofolate reductase [Pontibacter cellulosilyticus]MBC5994621.1 dihydrofolate reductase [Pontibacter cellulosilyticus]
MVSIIVATAENNVIGKDNQLIWHLPADLKHFKQLTMGHPILMGRKTYESIGKPLPGRTSIIITRQKDYKAEGCIVAHSVKEAIAKAKEIDEKVCIIGGAEIYKQALPLTDCIELTKIHHTFDGDTFFPEIKEDEWTVTAEEKHEPDEKNKYSYTFQTLRRK